MDVDFRVEEIPVPASAVHTEDPYDLVFAVVTLVNRTIFQGGFVRTEMPVEIFRSYSVDYYLTQVNNGGHDQFAANSACLAATLTDIRIGLAAMGDSVAAGIFRDFEARRDADPEAFDAAINTPWPGPRLLDDLDDRFFAGPSGTLLAANAAWLRSLPQLKPVPDAAYEAAMTALLASNPNAAARIAEREADAAQRQDRDPFVQTLRCIAERPDSGILFDRWLGGWPIESPGGRKGGHWTVLTSKGQADILIFPEKATFQLQDGDAPLVIVPIEAVRQVVRARTGEDIPVAAFGSSAADDVPPPPPPPPPVAGGWFRTALHRLRSGLSGR